MNLLNKLFGKKEEPINNYEDFWKWFQKNEKAFLKAVKDHSIIEKQFFDKLLPKLGELRDGFYFLAGMEKDGTAELILTADGEMKNIVFVEELVAAAPKISGWKFIALKPETDIEDFGINMYGYKFTKDNLFFYANDLESYPDEIDLTIVHEDYSEENKDEILVGISIFLDNYLGELAFATTIDNLNFETKENVEKDLIPIGKLKNFLKWRQKEFVEKYEGVRFNTDDDGYTGFNAESKNGNPFIAMINSTLLNWENLPSHPWIMPIEFEYDGENTNGLPDEKTTNLLNEIEDEILKELKDFDGYLNVGRQTGDGMRVVFFACKDFRKPAKVLDKIQKRYADKIQIDFEVFKDKYWQSFNHFLPQ